MNVTGLQLCCKAARSVLGVHPSAAATEILHVDEWSKGPELQIYTFIKAFNFPRVAL